MRPVTNSATSVQDFGAAAGGYGTLAGVVGFVAGAVYRDFVGPDVDLLKWSGYAAALGGCFGVAFEGFRALGV